ncbi:MAG: NUDIX hydrolase [bacterium]|nr:MAG: NUDIX hydrolase [bacterium]
MKQPQSAHFNFCPFCGDKSIELNTDKSRFQCLNCHNFLFFNSKPSVCAVIVRNNRILLVSDSLENNSLWDFPGGFLRYGEKPEDGLRRELREELGVEAWIGELLSAKIDTYSSDSDFSLNLFYATELKSETIRVGEEIKEAKWFELDRLPKIKFRSTKEVIQSL